VRDLLTPVSRREVVDPHVTYHILGAHWYAKGLYVKEIKTGSQIRTGRLYRVEHGDFVYNRLFAWKGSFAIATPENHRCYVSNEFPCFLINAERVDGRYLWRYFTLPSTWDQALGLSAGGTPTSRNRLKEEKLLGMKMLLPTLEEQRRIVARIEELAAKIEEARDLRRQASTETEGLIRVWPHNVVEDQSVFLGSLGQGILSMRNGLSRRPFGTESGPIVLRLADVASGAVDLGNPRRGNLSEVEVDNYSLSTGDLLFVRVNGSRDIVGRCVPFHGASEAVCFNDHLIRARLNSEVFDWRFVAIMANSPMAREYIERTAITTAGQKTVNHGMLAELPIPVLPLSQQRRIAAYLGDLEARIGGLKRLQAETTAELDALLPSILDKAFRGEL